MQPLSIDVYSIKDFGTRLDTDIAVKLAQHKLFLFGRLSPIVVSEFNIFKCDKCGREFGLKDQLDMHLTNYLHDENDKPTNDYRGTRTSEPSRKLY